MGTGSSPPILLLFLLLPLCLGASFTCKGTTKNCSSLLGYKPPNSTTYSSLQSLFTLPSLTPLLLSNNLSSTTSPSLAVPAGSVVRIPFPCSCSNSTGTSDKIPVYIVKPGDGLDHIARNIFGLFVTYQEIAAANGIKNPDLIGAGQRLQIPLPCSCDKVEGEEVVHYAYKVEKGDTFESIGIKLGVDSDIIMRLNGISDSKNLLEEQILNVPLRAGGSGSTANRLSGVRVYSYACLLVLAGIAFPGFW